MIQSKEASAEPAGSPWNKASQQVAAAPASSRHTQSLEGPRWLGTNAGVDAAPASDIQAVPGGGGRGNPGAERGTAEGSPAERARRFPCAQRPKGGPAWGTPTSVLGSSSSGQHEKTFWSQPPRTQSPSNRKEEFLN